jgi:hypothetical protein
MAQPQGTRSNGGGEPIKFHSTRGGQQNRAVAASTAASTKASAPASTQASGPGIFRISRRRPGPGFNNGHSHEDQARILDTTIQVGDKAQKRHHGRNPGVLRCEIFVQGQASFIRSGKVTVEDTGTSVTYLATNDLTDQDGSGTEYISRELGDIGRIVVTYTDGSMQTVDLEDEPLSLTIHLDFS